MAQKVKVNEYILSPRFSIIRMLEDFLAKNFELSVSELSC